MAATPNSQTFSGPILISGSYRSGTTFVAEVLSQSPELGVIFEPFNPSAGFGMGGHHVKRWCTYLNEETDTELFQKLKHTLEFECDWDTELKKSPSSAEVLNGLRLRYQMYQAQNRRPLMKDPFCLFSVPQIARHFGMKTLLMIRHPAAFVWSVKRLGWQKRLEDLLEQSDLIKDLLGNYEAELRDFVKRPGSIVEHAILSWKLMATVVLEFRTRHPHLEVLTHEKISRDPINEFGRLCNHFGLELSSGMKTKIQEMTNSKNPVEAPPDQIHHLYRNSEQNIFAWKRHLSDDEVLLVRNRTESISQNFYADQDW